MKDQNILRQIGKALQDTKKFETGAVRSKDADDTRYDLISPIGLERLARTCSEGAEKYGDHNWERGMPVTEMLNHALRHIYKYLSGDREEDHLAHAAWNLLGAIHSEEKWPELNKNLRSKGCDVSHLFVSRELSGRDNSSVGCTQGVP